MKFDATVTLVKTPEAQAKQQDTDKAKHDSSINDITLGNYAPVVRYGNTVVLFTK
ncbi:hypothetical protein [Enterococcus sp. AZ192]|uniref:hypothetical protein n=1 Tax=unclassified Enterococcus TaxID=2608891 RepID=UPI003D2A9E2A